MDTRHQAYLNYRPYGRASRSSVDGAESRSITLSPGHLTAQSEEEERTRQTVRTWLEHVSAPSIRASTPYNPNTLQEDEDRFELGAGRHEMRPARDIGLAPPPQSIRINTPPGHEPVLSPPLSSQPRAGPLGAPSEERYQEPASPAGSGLHGAPTLAFSPDSEWLATGDKDGTIVLRKTVPFSAIAEQTTESAVGALAFSLDGRRLASAHSNGYVEVWSIEHSGFDGGVVDLILQLNCPCPLQTPLLAVSWYPDSKRIAMCSKEGAVYFLDPRQNNPMVVPPAWAIDCPPAGTLTFAQFSPDTTLLALGFSGEKRNCELQNVATGKLHTKIPGRILNAQFNASGTLIVTCEGDNAVRVWDTRCGFPKWRQFESFSEPRTFRARDATLSPDDKYVLVAEDNGELHLWWTGKSLLANEPCLVIDDEEAACITSVLFSPDGKHIAHMKDDGSVGLRQFGNTSADSSDSAGTRYGRV